MRRFAALAIAGGVLATVYVAACVLPGEPSGPQRIQFTFDSLSPYRVPLAGSVAPSIVISADGQVLRNPSYRLETLNAGIVRVDATGRRLLGIARGTDSVRVTYLGATGTPDTVFPVQVVISRVGVDRSALAFTQLEVTRRLSAIAFDAENDTVADVHFAWSSADTTVAAVNDSGMVTAVYEGATTITAKADGVADFTKVTVTQEAVRAVRVAPGLDTLRTLKRSMQFIAVALDSTDVDVPGAKARWSSSDSSVATVDATLGLATARRAGTAWIIARVGQAWDSATLVVKQLARFIIVTPDLFRLSAINDTARVSAIVRDSGLAVIPNAVVTWATNDSTIATVDQTGLLRAHANGLAKITATSQSASAVADVVVRQEIAAAQISRESVALTGAGDTVRLSVVGLDRNGIAVDGARFTWRSNDGFVAAVDTAGLVTALGDGSTGIVATVELGGQSDTATVSVTGAPQPAALLIRTSTAGIQPDSDGYFAVFDNSSTHHLGSNDSVALITMSGVHVVELTDLAHNCSAWDNPRSVNVPARDTLQVHFAVNCQGPPDSVVITTTTTGGDLDPDGYVVAVDESCWGGWDEPGCYYDWMRPVGVNGAVEWAGLRGTHTVWLLDVAENCTVEGANPRTVTTSPTVTHVTFNVSCVQTGSMRVTTATTGADLDPDGYEVSVSRSDGSVRSALIGVNASYTIERLPPGEYGVSLTGVAGNCTLAGLGVVTVTISGGVTTDVAFAVTCAPLAAIRVTVTTTGVDLDPDGYVVTAAGPLSGSRAVAPNGTVVIDSLREGTYTVTLYGVAGNCTVSGPGAVIMVTIKWGVIADVAFAVTCPPRAVIRVTVATTGVDPDSDGYVALLADGSGGGAVAPNGTVVIDSLREGTYTVVLQGVAPNCAVTTTNPLAITVAPGDTVDAAFAVACTTASQLAVVRNVDGIAEIYLVNTSGAVLSRLTGAAQDPAWSPDGSKIAFASTHDGEIYVMSADGSGQTQLTFNGAADLYPAWSPDGRRIAFVSERDGNAEVYVMNADGSSPVRLTANGAQDLEPAWSPDGLRIAFASDRDRALEIYQMNADGSGVTRLTVTGWSNHQPDWSPDGTKLVFSREYCYWATCWDYVIVWSGSEVAIPGGRNPVWSRDGGWIAFDTGGGVWAIRPNGTGQVAILANASQPAWKP